MDFLPHRLRLVLHGIAGAVRSGLFVMSGEQAVTYLTHFSDPEARQALNERKIAREATAAGNARDFRPETEQLGRNRNAA